MQLALLLLLAFSAKAYGEGGQRLNEIRDDEADTMLYNGRPITAGELKPSVYIGNCTATIIGKEVLITAAHCRSTGSSAAFTYENTRYSGKCKAHPEYNRGGYTNNDFALCKFSPPITLPVYGFLSKRTMVKGDKLIMQGYGKGSNGVLNVGESEVSKLDNQDITTNTSVSLGSGDSGGGLFVFTPDLVNGPFEWVGVNSRRQVGGNQSFFNRADLERSQTFFNDYASSEGVEICGVNKDCGGGSTTPGMCEEEKAVVRYFEDALEKAKGHLALCLR